MCLFLCVKTGKEEQSETGCHYEWFYGKHVKSKGGFMVTVEWENANELGLGELAEMAEDGYCFSVSDGRIRSVTITVSPQS